MLSLLHPVLNIWIILWTHNLSVFSFFHMNIVKIREMGPISQNFLVIGLNMRWISPKYSTYIFLEELKAIGCVKTWQFSQNWVILLNYNIALIQNKIESVSLVSLFFANSFRSTFILITRPENSTKSVSLFSTRIPILKILTNIQTESIDQVSSGRFAVIHLLIRCIIVVS